jgi:hypothetical protein
MFHQKSTFFALVSIVAIISCKDDTPTPSVYDCVGVAPTYTTDVKPILDNSCATYGCHNSSAAGDKNLSAYALVKVEAVKASFLGALEHKSGFESMPQGASKLSDANIKTIACWIENGMLE